MQHEDTTCTIERTSVYHSPQQGRVEQCRLNTEQSQETEGFMTSGALQGLAVRRLWNSTFLILLLDDSTDTQYRAFNPLATRLHDFQ